MFYSGDVSCDHSEEVFDDYCGVDSDNNSELEEIEEALYNQIHFEDNCSPLFDNQEQQLFLKPGPEGDNRVGPALSQSAHDLSDSVCVVKSKPTRTSPKHLAAGSTPHHGLKRKREGSEEQSSASEPSYVMDQLSSGSESGGGGGGSSTPGDIRLHVHIHQSDDTATQSASGDQENWSIIEQDRTPTRKSTTSRYYKPIGVRCRNCSEIGHLSRSCPRPQKSMTCFLCGESGHFTRTCPSPICFNCDCVTDHQARDCPHPRRRIFDRCHRCGMRGHIQANCPDLWRQYHLTTLEGKLIKGSDDGNPRVFCHNCGEDGHFGYVCEEEKMHRLSQPVYPFIARYQKFQPQTLSTKAPRSKTGTHTRWIREPPRKKRKVDKIPCEDQHVPSVRQIKKREELNKTRYKDQQISKAPQIKTESKLESRKAKRKAKRKRKMERKRNATVTYNCNSVTSEKKAKKKTPTRAESKHFANLNRMEKIRKAKIAENSTILKPGKSSKTPGRKKSSLQVSTNRGFKITLPNLYVSNS